VFNVLDAIQNVSCVDGFYLSNIFGLSVSSASTSAILLVSVQDQAVLNRSISEMSIINEDFTVLSHCNIFRSDVHSSISHAFLRVIMF
jgi:hypothetical protein